MGPNGSLRFATTTARTATVRAEIATLTIRLTHGERHRATSTPADTAATATGVANPCTATSNGIAVALTPMTCWPTRTLAP